METERIKKGDYVKCIDGIHKYKATGRVIDIQYGLDFDGTVEDFRVGIETADMPNRRRSDGLLWFNTKKGHIYWNDKVVKLTGTEYQILKLTE